MTKKDYIKLAEVIKEVAIGGEEVTDYTEGVLFIPKHTIINTLCDILEDDNPRFDRERFITACK